MKNNLREGKKSLANKEVRGQGRVLKDGWRMKGKEAKRGNKEESIKNNWRTIKTVDGRKEEENNEGKKGKGARRGNQEVRWQGRVPKEGWRMKGKEARRGNKKGKYQKQQLGNDEMKRGRKQRKRRGRRPRKQEEETRK